MDNILDMEKELELKMLIEKIEILELENTKLKILLKDSGIDNINNEISDEEAICVKQIARLQDESNLRLLSKDEVQKFDLLYKNLKIIQDNKNKNKKQQKSLISKEELMAIVKEQ